MRIPATSEQPLPPRLLRTPPPYADESLPGYLVRLTEANHYAAPQWWLPLAGLPANLLDGWQRLLRPGTRFERLAALTGLTVSSLQEWQQATHTKAAQRNDDAQICPACLTEENYCRRWWDELAVTICPRHHTALLDRCPSCRKRISWQRGRVSGCRCGADWRGSATPTLPESERLSLQWLGLAEATLPSRAQTLRWPARCRALLTLAAYAVPTGAGSLHAGTENTQLRKAFETAAAVLLGEAADFAQFCWQQERNGTLGQFAAELGSLANQPELAFLRISVERVVAQWSVMPARASYPMLEERFVTPREAQRRLQFSTAQWQRLLQAGKVPLHADPWCGEPSWVDTKRLDDSLILRLRDFSLTQTAHALGVPVNEALALVENGCLVAASGPMVDGFSDWRISGDAVARLYDQFEKPAAVCRRIIGALLIDRDLMRMQEVYEQLQQHGLRFSDWVAAVVRGEMQVVKPEWQASANGYRLTQFYVRRADFAAYLTRQGIRLPAPPESPTPKPVTWPRLAQRLGKCYEMQQRRFKRKGIPSYDVSRLRLAARRARQNATLS